jgi:hypothetical protein
LLRLFISLSSFFSAFTGDLALSQSRLLQHDNQTCCPASSSLLSCQPHSVPANGGSACSRCGGGLDSPPCSWSTTSHYSTQGAGGLPAQQQPQLLQQQHCIPQPQLRGVGVPQQPMSSEPHTTTTTTTAQRPSKICREISSGCMSSSSVDSRDSFRDSSGAGSATTPPYSGFSSRSDKFHEENEGGCDWGWFTGDGEPGE